MVHYYKNKENGQWMATQRIGSLSRYDLEGSFDEVIKNLRKEQKYYQDTSIKKPMKVFDVYAHKKGAIEVKFEKITTEWIKEDYYDDYETLVLKGTRKATPEEIAALEKKEIEAKNKHKEHELAEYERLKKQFSGE